jgi:starvation-inducible DNA-binding protein
MTPTTLSFNTRVGYGTDIREPMIELLNQQLADTVDLQSQTKQAHWNVKGADFYQCHLLFDKLAEEVEGYVDTIAERAAALGGTARGTARLAALASRIPEYPHSAVSGTAATEALAQRYAKLCASTRDAIEMAVVRGDPITADLFTEVARGLETGLWFLESHLQS